MEENCKRSQGSQRAVVLLKKKNKKWFQNAHDDLFTFIHQLENIVIFINGINCLLFFFQEFSTQITFQYPEGNSSVGSKRVINPENVFTSQPQKDNNCEILSNNICIPTCECVYIKHSEIEIRSWIILYKWMNSCISQH